MSSFPGAKNNSGRGLGAVVATEVVEGMGRAQTLDVFGVAGFAVDEHHRHIAVQLLEIVELLDKVGDVHDSRMTVFL